VGTLTGSGTIDFKVTNSGILAPAVNGNTVQFVTLKNDYEQKGLGHLKMVIFGEQAANYGTLKVPNGTAKLGGTLDVEFQGYVPPVRERKTFTVVSAKRQSGSFREIKSNLSSVNIEPDYTSPTEAKIDAINKGTGGAGRNFTQRSVGQALDEATEMRFHGKTEGLYITEADIKRAGAERGLSQEGVQEVDSKEERINKNRAGALGVYIGALEEVPYDKIGAYLEQLAPGLAASIKDIAFNATNMQYGQITERLANIRAGAGGVSMNELSQEPMGQQSNQHEETLHDKDGKTVAYKKVAPYREETSPWSI
jgi:hypothetical protein